MYTPPIQDQKFVLEYLIGFDSIVQQLSMNGQNKEEIDKTKVAGILSHNKSATGC